MTWDEEATILPPPPKDPAKAHLENILQVRELSVIEPVRNTLYPVTHITPQDKLILAG